MVNKCQSTREILGQRPEQCRNRWLSEMCSFHDRWCLHITACIFLLLQILQSLVKYNCVWGSYIITALIPTHHPQKPSNHSALCFLLTKQIHRAIIQLNAKQTTLIKMNFTRRLGACMIFEIVCKVSSAMRLYIHICCLDFPLVGTGGYWAGAKEMTTKKTLRISFSNAKSFPNEKVKA